MACVPLASDAAACAGGRAPPAAFFALLIAAARCEHVTLFGFTCDRKDSAAAAADADLRAGPAWSSDEAAAAVAAEEKAWRIFIARRGAQMAPAREGPTARSASPQRRASPAP